jgi:hypothetical protein
MRKLVLLPLLLFAVACSDNMPVEPEMDLSPELSVALEKGGVGDVVKMVPFKAKGTWWNGSGPEDWCEEYEDQYPNVYAVFPESEGTGTHVGHFTGKTVNCIEDNISYRLISHYNVIEAANGDLIYVYGSEDDGTEMVIDWADPNLSFEILGAQIVGGTGRFENATGELVLSSPSIFGGPFTWIGEISSVGSSK